MAAALKKLPIKVFLRSWRKNRHFFKSPGYPLYLRKKRLFAARRQFCFFGYQGKYAMHGVSRGVFGAGAAAIPAATRQLGYKI